MRAKLEEVCRELIHHGRHFSPHRDAVVIRKCADYLAELADTYYNGPGEEDGPWATGYDKRAGIYSPKEVKK
jgi:hypothetical protein